MFLDDQPRVRALVADSLSESQSLRPMLETVRTAIIEKHPAISEFLCAAISKGLIAKKDAQPKVIRTIHHMFLLDTIIGGMYSDWTLMKDVADHLRKKRASFGIRDDFFGSAFDITKATGDLFFTAKAKTIDGVLGRLEDIRGNNYFAPSEALAARAV